ncbi:YcxB family protein [Actinocatenispora sera]|uniref:YcxB family protein n=1 Tax=Actinocatenispora sera TaxID=390989 RepID=UPI003408556D
MRVEFTARRDEQYWRQLMRDRLRSDSGWTVYLFWLLVLAVGLCFATGSRGAVVAGVAVLLVLVLLVQSMLFPVRRALRRLPSYASDPRRIVCDADGLTVESDIFCGRYGWGAFTRARQKPYAYLLFVGSQQYVDLPRAGLTGDQDEQLRELLTERGLLTYGPSTS